MKFHSSLCFGLLLSLPFAFPSYSFRSVKTFRILSRNFESFDGAWRALKAFIHQCPKKNRLMLFVPLAYLSLGPSIGLLLLLINLPCGFHAFFSINFLIDFLHPSLLLLYLVVILAYCAQIGLTRTIAAALFMSLIVVLIIGLFYESAFQNKLRSPSLERLKFPV